MSDQLQLWDGDAVLHNVFFAIRPTAEAAARIERVARELTEDGRFSASLLSPEHFHVSLFAIGSYAGTLPPAVLRASKAAAMAVPISPFTVAFDRIATFGGGTRRRAIVLMGGDSVAGLVRFQQGLRTVMMKAGLGTRQASRFTPHLTMMYADAVPERSILPIAWIVKDFVLIDSLYGQSKHVLLGQWT